MGQRPAGGPGAADRELGERLAAFCAGRLGVEPGRVRVEGLRRLAGGASRELWSLDLRVETEQGLATRELVLRRDPPGRVGEGDLGLEFRLIEAAAAAGVPVPRPHWCATDPAVLGTPFFLMDRVAGETIPRRLLREERFAKARERLPGELGAALARIHAVDPARVGLGDLGAGGGASARAEVERIAASIRARAAEPHPVLDLAERWLLERAPEPRRRCLVHGDYRMGNLVVDEEGLRAVLDWEIAHLGDPVEDLGWLCVKAWRFGNDALPVGGVGTREELLAAYEVAGGGPVDREALRFWEVAGNFKLALVFILQSRVFLDGLPSVELASLGRRIAEAEAELLELMEARASAPERP
jgi:aminoglycoside phosphotransferase (APT) family kinase protein